MAKNKKIAIGAAIILFTVIVVILLTLFLRPKGYRTIKLVEIGGEVSYDRGEDKDIPVYIDLSLTGGDTLRTGANKSYAQMKLDENKYAFMEESSEVDFTIDSGRTGIELRYGAITNEILEKLDYEESYEVETPNSLMAVRGTKFRISSYEGKDGITYTRVTVFEGTVASRLVYSDGRIEEDVLSVERGREALIYHNPVSGATDYALFDENGNPVTNQAGSSTRAIQYAQIPIQALEYIAKRVSEGETGFGISTDILNYYMDNPQFDEPTIALDNTETEEIVAEEAIPVVEVGPTKTPKPVSIKSSKNNTPVTEKKLYSTNFIIPDSSPEDEIITGGLNTNINPESTANNDDINVNSPVIIPEEWEPIVENPPIEEPPVDESVIEEEPVIDEEPSIEEPPIEEPPVEEPPIEEPPVEEPPVEEPPVEEPEPEPEYYIIDEAELEGDLTGKYIRDTLYDYTNVKIETKTQYTNYIDDDLRIPEYTNLALQNKNLPNIEVALRMGSGSTLDMREYSKIDGSVIATGGRIDMSDGATITNNVQLPTGSMLTMNNSTIEGTLQAGNDAYIYIKGDDNSIGKIQFSSGIYINCSGTISVGEIAGERSNIGGVSIEDLDDGGYIFTPII